MTYIDFITSNHKSTKRDYLKRVNEYPKAKAADIACKFEKDYWDGDRKFGYGGYTYDGRWQPIAEKFAKHYDLKPGDKILDIGCGKAFLLYEIHKLIPNIEIFGIDISKYAIENAKNEIKENLIISDAEKLPFKDNYFDFVYSINTLHNLPCFKLEKALKEMQRVGKKKKHLTVESYRNNNEKVNLLYWQLTCESFYSPDEWLWWFNQTGYDGDYAFIYFE